MKYKVNSEIGPLRFVITHTPGIEHEYVTPKNLVENNPDDYLLFDDIIQIQKAREIREIARNRERSRVF